jgi:putative membrane protein|tara:strand:- start:3010 stop:3537 length:528 start_codon:yes stop_codon:yes gene_type:complete
LLLKGNDSFWLRIIYIVSFLVSAAVAFLILGPRPEGIEGIVDVSSLPTLNAILNGSTGILLIYGYVLIIQKKRQAHKNVMLISFACSTAFLISYIIYHWFKSGPKEYIGDLQELYYFILITHIILAAIIIPLALITLYRGWNDHIGKHRKIAKITLPIWLYVSITGVMIYYMLYW